MTMLEASFLGSEDPSIQPNAWTSGSVPKLVPIDPSMAEWKKVIGKLFVMMSLRDDWDGLDSPAPHPGIVASAIYLAENLITEDYPPPTRVVATPSGTVGFEWQQPGVYMEAEIVMPYRSEWMQIAEGMSPQHWVIPTKPFLDSPREPIATTTTTVAIHWRELYADDEEKNRILAFDARARFRQNAQSTVWTGKARAM